jgi:hypothetical protein
MHFAKPGRALQQQQQKQQQKQTRQPQQKKGHSSGGGGRAQVAAAPSEIFTLPSSVASVFAEGRYGEEKSAPASGGSSVHVQAIEEAVEELSRLEVQAQWSWMGMRKKFGCEGGLS